MIVCDGSREITKEEEEEENSDVNDGSMRSNNCNIHTEKYLDAASEPGVVGSGCGWLHGAGILPELYNVEEYLSSHLSAPLSETFKRRVVQEIHLLEKASGSGA